MTTLRGLLLYPLGGLLFVVSSISCAGSNFGGGSDTKKGSSLDQNAGVDGSGAGVDASDGSLGNSDSAADVSDAGMNDLGGRDSDVPGADSSDSNGSGGTDGDGDNGGEDGDGEPGDDDDPDDDDDDPNKKNDGGDDAEDDDETLAKTKYGATITRNKADDAFDLKIEVLVNGKVLNSANLSFDAGDEGETKTAAAVCRSGKDTCLRLTFTSTGGSSPGHVETAGASPCVFVKESGSTATVDVDTNGSGSQGTCKENEDEQLTISCPNSKKLQVQTCGS